MHYISKRDSYRSAFSFFPLAGVKLQPEIVSMTNHIISLAVIIAYDRLKIHLVVRILSTYNYIIIRIGPNQSGAIIVRYIQFLNIHNFPIVIDKQLQVLFRTQIDFISTTIDCSGKISE